MTDYEEENKTITLTVPTQGSVPVISISDWIIFMHRDVASGFNWNLTWNDYKNGFGSSGSEDFWLGLERLELRRRTSGSVWRGSTFWRRQAATDCAWSGRRRWLITGCPLSTGSSTSTTRLHSTRCTSADMSKEMTVELCEYETAFYYVFRVNEIT